MKWEIPINMNKSILTRTIASSFIIVGVFLTWLSFYHTQASSAFAVLVGLGTAFLAGGIFTIISDVSFSTFILSFVASKMDDLIQRLTSRIDAKVDTFSGKLDQSVDTLTKYTTFLSDSRNLGITSVFPERRSALAQFLPYLKRYVNNQNIHRKEIIIVCSSLRGIIGKFPDIADEFEEVLKAAVELMKQGKCNVNILLTHPAYSHYREAQESRQNYDIAKEILHGISWLEDIGLTNQEIKVYKGTPTTFMIASSEKMILNFYPYQTEAFNCFCLEVENNKTPQSIYRSFYDNHYLNPWRGETRRKDHYLQTNTISYIHNRLDGPVSDETKVLDDMKGPYGDFFVIDDEGTFYIAINIQKLKRDIVYQRQKDGSQKVIRIGDRLEVKVLFLHDDGNANWEEIGDMIIDPKSRDGYWEKSIEKLSYKSITMLGLFDPTNQNVFLHESGHPQLKSQPLPMLYKWLLSDPLGRNLSGSP
jgi:hypothetical protein